MMNTSLTREYLAPYREEILQRIREQHIRTVSWHSGRLFLISSAYPGYWMEHLYDPIAWAKLFPEDKDIAISHMRLFLGKQREDGMIPSYILDHDYMQKLPFHVFKAYTGLDEWTPGCSAYHRLIQECVSVGSLALEVWELDKTQDLSWYYERCRKWENWLCRNRMTRGEGLVEVYCGNETGHDNSSRFFGLKHPSDMCDYPFEYREDAPIVCDQAPLICPDVNAVFYGNRMALARMAELLGRDDEAREWREKAAQVKKRLMELCFDEETCFFYDVDKNGNKIRVKSISITNLFCEGVLDQELADRIYERYLANPKEFGTPYPFPGVSISDPTWKFKMEYNDWGYYTQGNVALRTTRWMKKYGREKEFRQMMEIWLKAWCRPDITKFGQELHPLTGEPTRISWYSATMLYLLTAIRELGLE